jgi:hypothetical protein
MITSVSHNVARIEGTAPSRPVPAKTEAQPLKPVQRDAWKHTTAAAIGAAVTTLVLCETYHQATKAGPLMDAVILASPSVIVGATAGAIVGKRTQSTPWALGAGAAGGAVGVLGLQIMARGGLSAPGILLGAGLGLAASGAMVGINHLLGKAIK